MAEWQPFRGYFTTPLKWQEVVDPDLFQQVGF